MATVLKAKPITKKYYHLFKQKIQSASAERVPKLTIIQVGDNPASNAYINMKRKACEKVGALFNHVKLKENISESEFISTVKSEGEQADNDGLLVQLPLPKHLSNVNFVNYIPAKKDVDGFHPENIYSLYAGKINAKTLLPCTPMGIIKLLKEYNISIEGKTVCIAGRSLIVGRPMEQLLQYYGATTILCHSKTKNIDELISNSDIFISAIGIPQHFTSKNIRNIESKVFVDVGINRINNQIVGDLNFKNIEPNAKAITPVPGGVGPMTVLSLIENLITAWEENIKHESN